MSDTRCDCVVIGGGMSGMAAAVRLAKYLGKVFVVEKCHNLGGLNTFYSREGHLVESGLHAMTNFVSKTAPKSSPLLRLLRQLRIGYDELALRKQAGSSIRFHDAELRFDNDFDTLTAEVADKFPRSIDRFRAFDRFISGFDSLSLDAPPASARETVSEALQNPLLEDMLFCPLSYYGSAIENDMELAQFAIMYQSVFKEGFCRPAGGVKTLLGILEARLAEAGGEVLRPAQVSRIESDGADATAVVLADGTRIITRFILSSVGLPETFALCSPPPPPSMIAAHPPGRLAFVELVAFLRHPLADVDPRTIVFANRGSRFLYAAPAAAFNSDSVVVCRPDRFQFQAGDFVPPPMVRLTALASYDAWAAMDKSRYKEEKLRAEEELLTRAGGILGVPLSRGDVEYMELFTPLTVERFTARAGGAVYGSPLKRRDGRTHLRNLFICGTDQGFLGVVGAMLSGITVANARILGATTS